LIAATGAGGSNAQYRVNALGQRVAKALGGTTNPTNPDIRYLYDTQGRLIAETLPNGQTVKEYLYLHDLPVAVIVASVTQ
jgi:YD repeat-containing protein